MGKGVDSVETQERALLWALPLIRCVDCGASLELGAIRRRNPAGGLKSDRALRCRQCAREYPIVAGSPVMFHTADGDRWLPKTEAEIRRRTAESFAYEWEHFGELRQEWERNFRDYIRPHEPESLKGRLVLDVGAGSGRHSYEAHRLGAKVIAVDIGDAIHVARRNLPAEVVTVQADAEDLPFEEGAFDVVMAIGVLHHLPDTPRALRSIGRLVRPGGFIHIYVYWLPSREWHRFALRLVGGARRVTTRMPHPLLRLLCYPIAAGVFTTFVLPHRISRRVERLQRITGALPLKTYADYPFKVCVNDTFDRLSAPLESRFTAHQVEAMLSDAGFTDVVVLDNNGWIGSGRRPLTESRDRER